MGWFSKKPTVTEAVAGIGQAALGIRSAITGKADPATQLQFELEFQKLEKSQAILQSEINKVGAAHPSIFVAGWRPFIGWVCGFAFIVPMVLLLFQGMVAIFFPESPRLEALGEVLVGVKGMALGLYTPILLGMLGLSMNRSWEKYVGVDTKIVGGKEK